MGDLKNAFSWSFSRHAALSACPRRYYYQHYGSWGGWSADAPPDVRETYRLKQLSSRAGWVGQVLHASIARALHRARDEHAIEDEQDYVELVLESMRQDYRDSREDRARRTGRLKDHVRFFEHEEDPDDSDPRRRARWKEAAETVEAGLNNFFRSRLYGRLRELPASDWIEIEEPAGPPDALDVDGVKVFVKLDCAFRDDGHPLVVDWKTGRSPSSLTPMQLAAYALYLSERHGFAPEDVRAREINVVTGQVLDHDVGPEALATFREQLEQSVSGMHGYLRDVAENEPKPEGDFPFTEDDRACRFCNYRSTCPKISPAY